MKIVVYPSQMMIGGSQLVALDLARVAAQQGHEVIFFAPDGDLVPMVRDAGFEVVRAPTADRWPSLRNIVALTRLVSARGVDVVHAYEWGASVDLLLGPNLLLGTPLVTTVQSMDVVPLVPLRSPLVVGTESLRVQEAAKRPSRVDLIEPPVDAIANAPGAGTGSGRPGWGLAENDIVVSVVGRLVAELGKLGGVLEAIDAVGELADRHPVRLLVVGAGAGLDEVRARARGVNERHSREIVLVPGPMLDPSTAYEVADIVLGMGTSVLRGMAFGKPVVVQGEEGFWMALTKESLPVFLQQGWHGRGPAEDLRIELDALLADTRLREERGADARAVILERYGVQAAGEKQVDLYREAIGSPLAIGERVAEGARIARLVAMARIRRVRVVLGAARRRLGARAAAGLSPRTRVAGPSGVGEERR